MINAPGRLGFAGPVEVAAGIPSAMVVDFCSVAAEGNSILVVSFFAAGGNSIRVVSRFLSASGGNSIRMVLRPNISSAYDGKLSLLNMEGGGRMPSGSEEGGEAAGGLEDSVGAGADGVSLGVSEAAGGRMAIRFGLMGNLGFDGLFSASSMMMILYEIDA